jgi:hypothetical protein
VDFPHGRPTVTSADGGISLAIGEQFQYDVGRYFQAKRSVFSNRPARKNSITA